MTLPQWLGALREVPRDSVDMDRVRNDLTFSNSRTQETYQGWGEDVETVWLPRNYPPPWKGAPPRLVDARPERSDPYIRVTPRSTPRSDLQRRAIDALATRPGDKILCLGCGAGKTVVALHALAKISGFPALVVAPTSALMDQWRERIAEHLNLASPRSEIGLIQGSTLRLHFDITRDHENGLDEAQCPLVIGSLRTLATKELPEWVYDHFRIVIIDEAHRAGAPLLGSVVEKFSGERWSLTATPERDDGMTERFIHHTGPVALKDTKQALVPTVYMVHTGLVVDGRKFLRRGGMTNVGKLFTYLSEHTDRNRTVLWWIRKAFYAGRTCLVLGERREQLMTLQAEFGQNAGVFCGQLKGESRTRMEERRAQALQSRVTFATSALAKEGLDRVAFDTVFILQSFTGKGRLEQTLGRILRVMEGKKDPKAVVFVDDSYLLRWSRAWGEERREPGFLTLSARKMVGRFKELEYPVRFIRAPKREAP